MLIGFERMSEHVGCAVEHVKTDVECMELVLHLLAITEAKPHVANAFQ